MRRILRPLAVLTACVFVQPAWCAEKLPDAAKVQPKLTIDGSAVTEGKAPGLVSYADVVSPVQKAVVSVYPTKNVRRPVHPFFPLFGEQGETKERGLGSGVIVSADGYILTNNHVIEGADELNVQLPDGREMVASVIGADPKTDVAVIKIDGESLPSVVLADSDKLRVGDIVFAVGNPLGVGQTVTMGIVSATSREVGILEEVAGYESFIQTDAAINQGNSGGALIDAKGRLVGINSAILSTSRGNIGIGFSVPVNLAASIMHSLIETGGVTRGFLGVQVDQLTPEVAEALKLKKDLRGVIVNDVTDGGPAEKAGVKRSDVIVAINDKPITSRQELRLIVSQLRPDTEASLKVMRDGKDRVLNVMLGKLADAGRNELLPGVRVEPVTQEQRRALGIDPRIREGLVVTEVEPDSPYSERIVPNMVIIEINRTLVADLETARQLVIPGRNLFLVINQGVPRYISVTVR